MNGRIDEEKLKQLFDFDVLETSFDHVFACGPDEMMNAVESTLPNYGIAKEKSTPNVSIQGRLVNVALKLMQIVKKKK